MSEDNQNDGAGTRPRDPKLYVVKDSAGNNVYVKAKTKNAALDFVVGQHFSVALVQAKDMPALATAMSGGNLTIHEVE